MALNANVFSPIKKWDLPPFHGVWAGLVICYDLECGRTDTELVLGLAPQDLAYFALTLSECIHHATEQRSCLQRPKVLFLGLRCREVHPMCSRRTSQSEFRVWTWINCCGLKPLKFGMVCYTAVNDWHLYPTVQWPSCFISGLQTKVIYREKRTGEPQCKMTGCKEADRAWGFKQPWLEYWLSYLHAVTLNKLT